MKPSVIRLLSLVALVVPVGMTALAAPAGPGFPALALASAAGGAALLLAGPLFRVILSGLIAALGATVLLVALSTTAPEGAEGWIPVAIVAGILQLVAGIAVAVLSRRWPAATSRYSRTRTEGGSAIDDWDALSAGDDPTDVR